MFVNNNYNDLVRFDIMKVLQYLFWILYRIWFYILMAIPILIMFPFLLISILKESWYPFFFQMARIWAKFILLGMGFRTKITFEQEIEQGKSYMLVANHTSMTDIMLMLSVVKNPFVFVGKKELVKIPLFGFFYKRTCILVDRNSSKSRMEVFQSAQKRINQGLSICIFPEGGVPDENVILDEFKDGAFRLAIDHQLPIVPMSFYDNKRLFSYTFFSGKPGLMRANVHRFIETAQLNQDDKKELKNRVRTLILNELTKN
jgi:1-acyl-sn-glycerol-3-phosphate acyltransferase